MGLLTRLFGNKELEETFIDGVTSFTLSSGENEDEGNNGVFQNINCKLIKTVKYKRDKIYLIETMQIFTGLDFGIKAIPVNRFFIGIRRPSNFEKNKKNDVLVYLPTDINNPLNINFDELIVVDWAYIHNIKNEIEE